jgi:Amt family ammonium transporter
MWPAALALGAMLAPALGLAQDVPVPDKGDTAWMMTSTVLVILMTIPGLALFYAGMVRSKNVLSLLMQVFMTFCLMALLWAIYGYSLAFTQGSTPFIGGFDRLFLQGMTTSSVAVRAVSLSANRRPLRSYCRSRCSTTMPTSTPR